MNPVQFNIKTRKIPQNAKSSHVCHVFRIIQTHKSDILKVTAREISLLALKLITFLFI